MLDKLFTSKTRIKLLLKLFLNPEVSSYLRELSAEFELSPNALKEELDGLSQAGYLDKEKKGRNIFYKANANHPFFPEISSIVRKHFGIDRVIDQILTHLGDVQQVYILDDYAKGIDSGLIDVLVIGDVDPVKLQNVALPIEKKLERKIRTMVMSAPEFEKSDLLDKRPHWKVH
ncbi:winged helix-turn-helix domain-containing protein [Desulfovibrio subterraneus]|jgi:DNA-binding transcriptional ArsR family regulator|uniref:Transcriptional regulator n=1 Tax=Desulfovibrio subterraneus TaxID=2718620 RepID=A0A7J0BMN8_9BACT|nr:winged helix-turn-helix domain-containing protein [Desulfovibrio subterraneus]WBF66109.1 winged helix-turn-helix domain-containing protein [Desulfovibrio subterraneus]GFM35033.1 transcriptional regulator [Desulfovibrio subterraneus]